MYQTFFFLCMLYMLVLWVNVRQTINSHQFPYKMFCDMYFCLNMPFVYFEFCVPCVVK